MRGTSRQGWRRVCACLLAYALVLQGLIFALALGDAVSGAAASAPWAVELCAHDGAGAASVPNAPPQHRVADVHCLFCIAGAVYVNCAPPPALQHAMALPAGTVVPLRASSLAALLVNESAWPRGPPSLV